MTTIITSKQNPLIGTANGRPVAFCQGAWHWYYTDTNANEAAQIIRGQVRVIQK